MVDEESGEAKDIGKKLIVALGIYDQWFTEGPDLINGLSDLLSSPDIWIIPSCKRSCKHGGIKIYFGKSD
ncbi:hypothetical protein L6164_001098 [Bauhinia variegata]|uniref:Uncharacterized protein n=1 Tax=Bauhinia variegata TaxID=167791 RepID=A0ACB9Q8G4_BAUVA|nr:hypothetical protein L6164_001098 [Bauhinia variegata]